MCLKLTYVKGISINRTIMTEQLENLLARAKASHLLSLFKENGLDFETLCDGSVIKSLNDFSTHVAEPLGLNIGEKLRVWKEILQVLVPSDAKSLKKELEEMVPSNAKSLKKELEEEEVFILTPAKNNVCLLVRLPQSGKTQIMLDGITKFMKENRNTLVLILCDNNLMLTSQTRIRAENEREINVGKITSDANGYCEWKRVDSYDKPDKNDKRAAKTLKERVMNVEVNTLMMCSNKSRWSDVEIIINKFYKTHNIQLWIDEADKSVGGIDSLDIGSKRRIGQINTWKTMIHSINLITATPFSPKSRWSNFKWIGQNFGGVVELVKIPEVVGENYHHLCDSQFIEQEDIFETPAEYAKSYLAKNPAKPGDVLLIPGTTRQVSHYEVRDMCLNEANIDCVILLNGKEKGLYSESEDGSYAIIRDKTEKTFKYSLKNEDVAYWLGQIYQEFDLIKKTVVITGNLCISRGITISSPSCVISHVIFGCDGPVREEEQLLSRVCGYCYSLKNKPIVVCPLDIWNDVSKYQEVVIEISKLAMSENQEDRIFDESKLNSIIQNIDKHKRIPRMVDGFDGSEDIFVEKKLNKEQKIEFFKEQFPDLVNFMKESKCKQITMPKENGSYKKHVEDVFKKVQENKNFVIDFTPSDKESNCWMGIVDSRKNRLFVITWVVDSVNL
jgi:hypothetical protein